MEVLRSPPSTSSYVPLAEHQARTPASFYSGPPVLHYLSERCKVVILERDLLAAPALNALRGEHTSSGTANGNENGLNGSAQAAQNGEGEEEELGKEIVIDGVDVWVTSQYVFLFLSLFIFFQSLWWRPNWSYPPQYRKPPINQA